MQHEDFVCYKKNNNVLSVGMNLNNIVAKHYYSENVMNGGGFRPHLTIPLPLVILNHANSFFKRTINHEKTHERKCEVISDSMFDKLVNLKSKTNVKKTKKRKKTKRKKTKKKK